MNYWVISPNVTNEPEDAQSWKDAILKYKVAIMGWGDKDKLGRVFVEDVHPGDIMLIAQGANWQKRLFLAGQVATPAYQQHLPNTARSALQRRLVGCISAEELNSMNLDFDGSAYGDTKRIPAIYKLKPWQNEIDKVIAEQLKQAVTRNLELEKMTNTLALLRYKKQFILQGPPGTGKTRLAKILADEIIKAEIAMSPLEYIEWYIKNFPNTKEHKTRLSKRKELLEEFYALFPADQMHNLTLKSYCAGEGSKSSFCYWIEKKLTEFGTFSPGQAGNEVFLVYYKPEIKDYKVKNDIQPDEMLDKIKKAIFSLANLTDLDNARSIFRDSLSLRILSIYHPEKYFPVFSQKHLQTVAKIFEVPSKGVDDIHLNELINNKFIHLKSIHGSTIDGIDLMWHLYEKFKIKSDDIAINEVQVVDTIGDKKLIQFHPAFSYEDFVRGIVAEANQHGQIEYRVSNKLLSEFANKACLNPNINYVLIIDEINRANLPAVFGELIYALEYRGKKVESLYDIDGDNSLVLPPNLYIIGTMNTADRSVGHIDYALRRRFAFKSILPNPEPVHPAAKSLFQKVSELFVKDYSAIDWAAEHPKLNPSSHLAPDFKPEDVWIGHSYFIAEDTDEHTALEQLELKRTFELMPLLQEYLKDGILLSTAQPLIEEIGTLAIS